MLTWIFSFIEARVIAICMIFIDFMKLAYSVQNPRRVRNASHGRCKYPVGAGKEVGFQQFLQ